MNSQGASKTTPERRPDQRVARFTNEGLDGQDQLDGFRDAARAESYREAAARGAYLSIAVKRSRRFKLLQQLREILTIKVVPTRELTPKSFAHFLWTPLSQPRT